MEDLRRDLVESSELQAMKVKGVVCIDSNMRAAPQAFQLRENLQRCGSELRWLASDYDLADSMTKKKGDGHEGLLKFMATWHWTIAYDPNFVAAKKNKKLGLTAVDKVD